MGHINFKNELYGALRERLDKNPIGLPEDINIYEILSILFTKNEAYVATKMPMLPCTFDQLKELTGFNENELKKNIAHMLNKGLVLKSSKKGRDLFMLSMALVGFFEFSFMHMKKSLPLTKLGKLIREYRLGDKFTHELFKPGTPRSRSLIYKTAKMDVCTEILTYEEANALVDQAGKGALSFCYCRHERLHTGYECKYPYQDICISLGNASSFLVEHGFARRAEISEIKEKLIASREMGLPFICDNVKDNIAFICSCCSCCCCFLAGITHHKLPYAVATTSFIANVSKDDCKICGTCKEKCQAGAISLKNDASKVNEKYCLGCGVCSTFCPEKAITMKEREKKIIPPSNMRELYQRLKQERGGP
jgi:Pyruvate/2-oxoacid:ferredoxin oxidoreductase delta subunit